jgi:PAS domain-containing protein
METLQEELRRQNERYWRLFDDLPQAYVVTRPDSVITEVNKAGAQLFNVSQRFLVGKALSVFVCENRGGFLAQIGKFGSDPSVTEMTLKLRPRERAPLTVSARVKGDAETLRWLLRPITATETDPTPS